MEQAITYKDLYLSYCGAATLESLEIIQRPDRHGRLCLTAVLDNDGEGEVFDRLPEEVSLFYRQEGEQKILYKGMVTGGSMKRMGGHRYLELLACDATYLLDTRRKTRSFQNTARTTHSVINEVMQTYPECICMKNLPEEPIGRIWFQYEETDWEFLRRFLSRYADSLYTDATYRTARFQAGLSSEDITVDWDDAPYCIKKDLAWYDHLSQNGFTGLRPENFVCYSVDSYGVYTLGSRLLYKGRPWYIGGLRRALKDGLLRTTYELKQREGLLKPQEYNCRITGISMDGKTAQVQNDRVRVTLNGDLTTEQGTYWFPYSTMAASKDGSGWYSMPEIGDSVRVYFPTWDEKEGYVITKHDSHMPSGDSGELSVHNSGAGGVRSAAGQGRSAAGWPAPVMSGDSGDPSVYNSSAAGYNSGSGSSTAGGGSGGGGGSTGGSIGGSIGGAVGSPPAEAGRKTEEKKEEHPMDDPSKRNIFTKDGCVVQLVPAGVILNAGESTLMLKKSGEVVMDAPGGVSVYAGDKLVMTADSMALAADTLIMIKNAAGSDITIRKEEIKLHAQEIYEN